MLINYFTHTIQEHPPTKAHHTYRYIFVVRITSDEVPAECQDSVCGIFRPIHKPVALLRVSVNLSAGVSKIILLKACR